MSTTDPAIERLRGTTAARMLQCPLACRRIAPSSSIRYTLPRTPRQHGLEIDRPVPGQSQFIPVVTVIGVTTLPLSGRAHHDRRADLGARFGDPRKIGAPHGATSPALVIVGTDWTVIEVRPSGLAVGRHSIYISNYGLFPGSGSGPHGQVVRLPA